MKKHQRIWVQQYGPIPKESCGRSYEIHHIDGNHENNNVSNLQCVTITEHFNIHLQQGDTQAAAAILRRLKRTGEDVSKLSQLAGYLARDSKTGIHGLSAEQRSANARKGAQANIGKFWFTDGSKNTRAKESPGPLWREGRTLKPFARISLGRKLGEFWNNGSINRRFTECPGSGWVRGKLLTDEQRSRRSDIAKEVLKRRWQKTAP